MRKPIQVFMTVPSVLGRDPLEIGGAQTGGCDEICDPPSGSQGTLCLRSKVPLWNHVPTASRPWRNLGVSTVTLVGSKSALETVKKTSFQLRADSSTLSEGVIMARTRSSGGHWFLRIWYIFRASFRRSFPTFHFSTWDFEICFLSKMREMIHLCIGKMCFCSFQFLIGIMFWTSCIATVLSEMNSKWVTIRLWKSHECHFFVFKAQRARNCACVRWRSGHGFSIHQWTKFQSTITSWILTLMNRFSILNSMCVKTYR